MEEAMEDDNRALKRNSRIFFRVSPVNPNQETEFNKGVFSFYYASQIPELQVKICFAICFNQNQKTPSKPQS